MWLSVPDLEKAAEKLAISTTVSWVLKFGGIPGYQKEHNLTANESELWALYVSLGVCEDTANKLFWAGLDPVLNKFETTKQIMYVVLNINEKKTPMYLEKYKVHIAQQFTNSLITFIQCLKYQPFIRGASVVAAWNCDPDVEVKTVNQLNSFNMMNKSNSGSDLDIPEGLRSMKKFIDFYERLLAT